jgi:hypothetical protein
LTFGDTLFMEEAEKDQSVDEDIIDIQLLKISPVYNVLKYHSQLLGFLLAGLGTPQGNNPITSDVTWPIINSCLNNLGLPNAKNFENLEITLTKLTSLALAYVAIYASKYNLYKSGLYIGNYDIMNPENRSL